jgi:hypothetical protein
VEVSLVLEQLLVRVLVLWAAARERVGRLRREPDAGYNTEATIVIALLAAAAITIVGIIVGKITGRANSIDLDEVP